MSKKWLSFSAFSVKITVYYLINIDEAHPKRIETGYARIRFWFRTVLSESPRNTLTKIDSVTVLARLFIFA